MNSTRVLRDASLWNTLSCTPFVEALVCRCLSSARPPRRHTTAAEARVCREVKEADANLDARRWPTPLVPTDLRSIHTFDVMRYQCSLCVIHEVRSWKVRVNYHRNSILSSTNHNEKDQEFPKPQLT